MLIFQLYDPIAVRKYQAIVNDANDAIQRVRSRESTILLRDFNAHIGTDIESWKGVIGRHRDPALNENGRYFLQLRCSNSIYL